MNLPRSRHDLQSDGVLSRIEAAGLRVPFTLATVGMLVLAGWLTNSAKGEQLGVRAIARLGFAPADTPSLDVTRAVGSVFVTNGPAAFWFAIAATAVLVGLTEWRYGSAARGHRLLGDAPHHIGADVGPSGTPASGGRRHRQSAIPGPRRGALGGVRGLCSATCSTAGAARAGSLSLAVGVVVLGGTARAQPGNGGDRRQPKCRRHSRIFWRCPSGFVLGLLTSRKPRPRSRRAAERALEVAA